MHTPATSITHDLFFQQSALDKARTQSIIDQTLHGMDDGELFLEYTCSESLLLDDGVLKHANNDISQGFGLRSVLGELTGYAFASELSEAALLRAADTVKSIKGGDDITPTDVAAHPSTAPAGLYVPVNPLETLEFSDKISLLQAIDTYLRAKDPRVKQVSASIAGEWNVIQIIRAGGFTAHDVRPLVRINVSVVVEQNGRMERGSYGTGGRMAYTEYTSGEQWKSYANEALRQALVNLDARPCPAGEMPVILASGWPGILLHEAVGHGLEGDFNRKQTSAFSGRIGEQVAAKGVTVIDNGTIEGRRGSLTFDDEGTPTSSTVLIEDGILRNYMQDRQNARLMGMSPTGNGRRESFEYAPLPRMTNTYMSAGDRTPEDIIASVEDGIYAVSFSGGQVDITSGKFVFSASEAYRVENGKITYPVKGATLIGNGPDTMQKVAAIGNDMALDPGIGTCGKAGQGVPVGVGQPTMLIDNITVGGTEV